MLGVILTDALSIMPDGYADTDVSLALGSRSRKRAMNS